MQVMHTRARLWNPWTDYVPGRFQLTSTELAATFAIAIASVSLAFAGPYIFSIVLSSLHGLTFISSKHFYDDDNTEVQGVHEGESDRPLLRASVGDADHESTRAYGTMTIQASANVVESAPAERPHIVRQTVHKLVVAEGPFSIFVWSIAALLWTVFVVHTIGFVFTEKNPTDAHVALWNTPTGGLFEPASTRGNLTAMHASDLEKERRAGAYAKGCYEVSLTSPTSDCSFFYRPNIGSFEKHRQTCSFPNKTACLNHDFAQCVTFDTMQGHDIFDGRMKKYIYKNASDLGINVRDPYRWSRTMNCVPLSMEEPYVRSGTDERGITTFWYRHLQPMDNRSDFVWSSTGDPFEERAAGYTVRAFTTHYNLSGETYKAHPGIRPSYQSRLTIIYISAGHILYDSPSADPIFPADAAYTHDNKTYYRKSDPKATALACDDMAEVCDEFFCQRISLPFHWGHDEESEIPDLWWLKQVLKKSDAYHAIRLREGDALIATEMIHESVSPGLGDGHWVNEARRIFNTSLAWAQFATWDIADGAGKEFAGNGGYQDNTPIGFAKDLGRMFKFRAVGSRNVPIWPLAFCVLAWPVTFVLSWRLSSIRIAVKATSRCLGRNEDRSRSNENGVVRTDEDNGASSTRTDEVKVDQGDVLATKDGGRPAVDIWEPLLFSWLFILGPWHLGRFAFWSTIWIIVGHIAVIQWIATRQRWPEYMLTANEGLRSSAIDIRKWLSLPFA